MSQQLHEVHPRRTHDCIDPVSLFPLEPVFIHSMTLLQMTDRRLDRCPPLHPPPETLGGPPTTGLVTMDFRVSFIIVTPIPLGLQRHDPP